MHKTYITPRRYVTAVRQACNGQNNKNKKASKITKKHIKHRVELLLTVDVTQKRQRNQSYFVLQRIAMNVLTNHSSVSNGE